MLTTKNIIINVENGGLIPKYDNCTEANRLPHNKVINITHYLTSKRYSNEDEEMHTKNKELTPYFPQKLRF